MEKTPFHLSVVATTRNDNHGGDLTCRMQHFIDGLVAQCNKHRLRTELILVEWNPPDDRPSLVESLRFPSDNQFCAIRIIQVPREVHLRLKHGDRIALYQMIGKNVGIQRALGTYVLATNIDILFSDELMRFLKHKLRPGILYRVDRLDIPSQLPKGGSFDDLLDFCKRSFFRINGKEGTTICPIDSPLLRLSYRYSFLRTLYRAMGLLGKVFLKTLRWFYKFIVRILSFDRNVIVHTLSTVRNMIARIQHRLTNKTLHTNACGDFTLMSKKNWEELRGYPEWDLFSWHLDSIVLYQARQHGIQEKDLPMKCAIYHIEHGKGYTPEGAQELFARLSAQKIPYLTNEMLDKTVRDMNASHEKVVYNQADWGFSNLKLKETQITR